MIPGIGRIVHYTLTEGDASLINRSRINDQDTVGNAVRAGDVYPMMITNVWSEDPQPEAAVNGQVFLDGNTLHWVTSVTQGDGERHWRDPREVS